MEVKQLSSSTEFNERLLKDFKYLTNDMPELYTEYYAKDGELLVCFRSTLLQENHLPLDKKMNNYMYFIPINILRCH